MSRKKNIDETDILILNELQRDAHISNVDLSKRVGLSPGPTWTRVNKLIEKKAIDHIVAKVNYGYFGYTYRAMVVSRIPAEHADQFTQALRGLDYVLTAHRIQSSNRLSTMVTVMFEVIAKTENAFVDQMAKHLQSFPFLVDFEIFPVTQVIKDVTVIKLEHPVDTKP